MTTRPRCRAAASLLLLPLAALGCTAEPELVFADWIYQPPADTPIHEYAAVPIEGRDPNAVSMVEDLVIGTDLSNPAAVLYQPGMVVAADNGDRFVADFGANDVKMFAADGSYLRTLGKEGQGPGEFGGMGPMTIAGDRFVLFDGRNARFSVWTLDGEHVADNVPLERLFPSNLSGLADGSMIEYHTERDEERNRTRVLTRRALSGEEIARLWVTDATPPNEFAARDTRAMVQSMLDSLDDPRLLTTVGGGETVYLSPAQEYQVLALTPDGDAQWALRVAWERGPYPDSTKESFLESIARNFPPDERVSPDDFDWPAQLNAVAGLSTDAAGRLYVFPAMPPAADGPVEEWPVDVYSPSGERLATGVVQGRWSSALGDHLYGVRTNDLDEYEVVRWRIAINGDR